MKAFTIRRLGITITLLDGVVFLVSLAVFLGVTAAAYSSSNQGGQVHVQAETGDYLYSLEQPGEFVFTGPIGETVVEIHDHRVRVLSSPCRDQVCVAAGWLEHENEWTACLPNKLFVRVEADSANNTTESTEEADLLSY
ncbi:NusG domain II-containing protein [Spirochaeta lutea]|uniref:NusG domain II-containing protein n=1 Tax=Spirochaeta lutea TaxID=1480694 RepID=UPI0006906464|nr:NusG domain II-containing protein [Spirochaeta lutea]